MTTKADLKRADFAHDKVPYLQLKTDIKSANFTTDNTPQANTSNINLKKSVSSLENTSFYSKTFL